MITVAHFLPTFRFGTPGQFERQQPGDAVDADDGRAGGGERPAGVQVPAEQGRHVEGDALLDQVQPGRTRQRRHRRQFLG